MNLADFKTQLPSFYEHWGQTNFFPKTSQFVEILEKVGGLNTPQFLQLLNLAVKCLEPQEIYCEIGCGLGASLISALWNNPNCFAYAVDDFFEFPQPESTLERLSDNISNFALTDQVVFCYQSFEDFFRELKQLEDHPVMGVFFYDGACDYHCVLLALLLAKEFMAENALIAITNANDCAVHQAVVDFQIYCPQAKTLFQWLSSPNFDPVYGNGYLILSWDINAIPSSVTVPEILTHKPLDYRHTPNQELKKQLLTQEAQKFLSLQLYDQAEFKFKSLLIYDENDLNSLFSLGKIYYHTHKLDQASKFLYKALSINSSIPEIHFYLGQVWQKTGRIKAAIAAYDYCIQLDSHYLDAYESLGNLLENSDPSQAESIYKQAIKYQPENIKYYQYLGNIYLQQEDWQKLIEISYQGIEYQPNNAQLLYNLALAYQHKGEAIVSAKYLGHYYYQIGNYSQAIISFQVVVYSEKTATLDVYVNLYFALEKIGDHQRSIQVLKEAIEQYKAEKILYILLIEAWQKRGENDKMLETCEEAYEVTPDKLYFYLRKKLILPLLYNSCLELEKYQKILINNLAKISQEIKLSTPENKQTAKEAVEQLNVFLMAYQGCDITEQQKQYGYFIDKIISACYPQWSLPLAIPSVNQGKIRLGYISESMNSSSSSRWLRGWLEYSDREVFEIYCYKTSLCPKDEITREIILHSDHFQEMPSNVELIAQQIKEDHLHILVYAGIGLDSCLCELAALRLAPIQCATWGHPVTSGMPKIDYFLSGELMEPDNAQEHYSEQLITLPNLGIFYQKPPLPEHPKTRQDFGLSKDSLLYLSCQLIFKYLPQYDYIFAEIARQVPQAKLVFILRSNVFNQSLGNLQDKFCQRLEKVFTAVGLNYQDYCVFLGGQDWESYLSLLLCVDVFLDTFTFSGGYTTFEAVGCNLPVVTCVGEFMRGRQSYGILRMLGVTETIATTQKEYVDIAVKLALEPQWRQQIVQKMSKNQDNLFKDFTSIKALEKFYQQVIYEKP